MTSFQVTIFNADEKIISFTEANSSSHPGIPHAYPSHRTAGGHANHWGRPDSSIIDQHPLLHRGQMAVYDHIDPFWIDIYPLWPHGCSRTAGLAGDRPFDIVDCLCAYLPS